MAKRERTRSEVTALFATAANLSRLGYEVSLTLMNARGIDLVAVPGNGTPFKIEVKGARGRNFVPISKDFMDRPNDPRLFLVAVLIPKKQSDPLEFFLLTHAEVKAARAAMPKAKKDGTPYAAGWDGLDWKYIEEHPADDWKKIPQI